MSKRSAKRHLAGAAMLFAALGDPTRLALLNRLSEEGPASISTLADRFSLTRQGVTKHLQVLAAAGVIDGERQGREHVWTMKPERLADARAMLDLIARDWDDALGRLKKQVETLTAPRTSAGKLSLHRRARRVIPTHPVHANTRRRGR